MRKAPSDWSAPSARRNVLVVQIPNARNKNFLVPQRRRLGRFQPEASHKAGVISASHLHTHLALQQERVRLPASVVSVGEIKHRAGGGAGSASAMQCPVNTNDRRITCRHPVRCAGSRSKFNLQRFCRLKIRCQRPRLETAAKPRRPLPRDLNLRCGMHRPDFSVGPTMRGSAERAANRAAGKQHSRLNSGRNLRHNWPRRDLHEII